MVLIEVEGFPSCSGSDWRTNINLQFPSNREYDSLALGILLEGPYDLLMPVVERSDLKLLSKLTSAGALGETLTHTHLWGERSTHWTVLP